LGCSVTIDPENEKPRLAPGQFDEGLDTPSYRLIVPVCNKGPCDVPSSISLSSFTIPEFKYFPTHLMDKSGPKFWARMRILQACERLEIPQTLWPQIPLPRLPLRNELAYRLNAQIDFPPFLPLQQTIAEWKSECQKVFDTTFAEQSQAISEKFQREARRGAFTKIPPVRGTTPIDLRYEWAAKKLYYRYTYHEISQQETAKGKAYTQERIKTTVLRILKEADLRTGRSA
jgi:hypothetical protein